MSVEIHYYDDEPAWKVVASDPERFRGVNYDLEIKLFRMPKGSLVAYWLRLYDVPDQPFFLHRVLDPTDEAIGKYLKAVRKAGKIVLVFESPGRQQGFAVELPVDARGLGEVLDGALKHAEHLGEEADGERTIEDFMEVFGPALKKEKSVDRAWTEVQKRFPYRPPRGAAGPPAASSWKGICGMFLAALVFILGGVAAKRATPYYENAALETPVVRPGYEIKLFVGPELRSIDGRWRGERPSFDLRIGDPSSIESVKTQADAWGEQVAETRRPGDVAPTFRPYVKVRLKDDPRLSGRLLEGTAALRVVYPTFSGVAYKDVSADMEADVSFRVFTFAEVLLVRASPLLLTAGALLVLLTVFAVAGRIKAEEDVNPAG